MTTYLIHNYVCYVMNSVIYWSIALSRFTDLFNAEIEGSVLPSHIILEA